MILYDKEFYAFRFASAHMVDLDWGGGCWTVVCRHDDALIALIDHVTEIQEKFPDHGVCLCSGARRTFRHDVWPEYKANRKDRRRPPGYGKFLEGINAAAKERGWHLSGSDNLEGDDLLGLMATPKDIIVSGDKDMMTLPGQHYKEAEVIKVTKWEADVAFYKQTLVGDSADNYPGCPGIGDKNKLFRSRDWLTAKSERDLWACVLGAFLKAGLTEQDAVTQARCARILRTGEYDIERKIPVLWSPPLT